VLAPKTNCDIMFVIFESSKMKSLNKITNLGFYLSKLLHEDNKVFQCDLAKMEAMHSLYNTCSVLKLIDDGILGFGPVTVKTYLSIWKVSERL